MKLIIVGAKGMLGHALAQIFRDTTPVLWDKDDCDISDHALVNDRFLAEKPDIVINAAAYTDVDGSETNRDLALAVNATGPGNIADACRTLGATVVHYSTDYVFDGTRAAGYTEDATPKNPVNFYGRSKLAGEELFLSPLKLFEPGTLNWYLIRTSWLFGPYGKNFVTAMLGRAEAGQREFKVVDDQFGKPTYTYDLAQTTFDCVTQKKPSGMYHATNVTDPASGITWYEFTKEIFRQAATFNAAFSGITVVPCTFAEFPRRASRPNYSALLNTKFPPLRPWQAALEDYLRHYVFA